VNREIPIKNQTFSIKVISWFHENKRDLPWRHTKDPYAIWLSEIILQQTRVAQGLPYYYRFLEKLPTVHDFANASQEEILRLWQGLGYYSRARNMHATAKLVVKKYEGKFPDSYNELIKLKGIGPYTGAAIASFAFDEAVPVVDGNVFRVLSRVFGIETDIASSPARKEFTELAQSLIPENTPADFNQAIMEFGALQCTPQKPNCMFCPLQMECYAFQHEAQIQLPVKLKKTKVRNRYFNYFAIQKGEEFVMNKRPENDIWSGLYDFYLVETEKEGTTLDDIQDDFISELLISGEINQLVESKKHILSHQWIFATFWKIDLKNVENVTFPSSSKTDYKFFSLDEIEALPKSTLTATFFKNMVV
jgi:A/G-specific adenine glycosylase